MIKISKLTKAQQEELYETFNNESKRIGEVMKNLTNDNFVRLAVQCELDKLFGKIFEE